MYTAAAIKAIAFCQVTRKTYYMNPWIRVSYKKHRVFNKPA